MTKVKCHKEQTPTCPKLLKTVVQTLLLTQILQICQLEETIDTSIVIDEDVIENTERFANTKALSLGGITDKTLKIVVIKYRPVHAILSAGSTRGRFP